MIIKVFYVRRSIFQADTTIVRKRRSHKRLLTLSPNNRESYITEKKDGKYSVISDSVVLRVFLGARGIPRCEVREVLERRPQHDKAQMS